jgi:glycosyltransferase involved in cell wall biosynthesis
VPSAARDALHGLHLARRLPGVRRRAAVASLQAVLRAADRTICVSETEHAELGRIVGPAAAKRAVVIRNGVRIPPPPGAEERGAVRDELAVGRDEIVAIWVGSLDERKDPLTAVRAATRAGLTLLVAGGGPLRADVERAAGPNVRVLGPRGDVPRLLAAADVYVATSRREGLSLSLLEAMAAGLAPVVTDLPEHVEAVGAAGLALPAADEAAFAGALSALAGDRDEREVRGRAARDRASDVFAVDGMTAATRAVYDLVSDG